MNCPLNIPVTQIRMTFIFFSPSFDLHPSVIKMFEGPYDYLSAPSEATSQIEVTLGQTENWGFLFTFPVIKSPG